MKNLGLFFVTVAACILLNHNVLSNPIQERSKTRPHMVSILISLKDGKSLNYNGLLIAPSVVICGDCKPGEFNGDSVLSINVEIQAVMVEVREVTSGAWLKREDGQNGGAVFVIKDPFSSESGATPVHLPTSAPALGQKCTFYGFMNGDRRFARTEETPVRVMSRESCGAGSAELVCFGGFDSEELSAENGVVSCDGRVAALTSDVPAAPAGLRLMHDLSQWGRLNSCSDLDCVMSTSSGAVKLLMVSNSQLNVEGPGGLKIKASGAEYSARPGWLLMFSPLIYAGANLFF